MKDEACTLDLDKLLWQIIIYDDEKAFEKLFCLFYPVLCVYAKRFIESQESREDIVQDVFVGFWEDRKTIKIETSIRCYFMTAVKNRCLNYLRKEKHSLRYQNFLQEQSKVNEFDNKDEIILLRELYELLDKALAKLPNDYRYIIEMHQFENKSYEEIAEALSISVSTAKRYKANATDLLKKELKDYLPALFFIIMH